MTVTRAALGRIQAQIARLRASLPPLCAVVDPEPEDTLEARIAEVRARAGARGVRIVIVDRDEGGAA